jgi:hypothetical protein
VLGLTDLRTRLACLVWATTLVVVVAAQLGQPHHTARHYFFAAARLLVGDGPGTGVHLYGSHPEFQFGPPAAVAVLPFSHLDGAVAGPLLTVALFGVGLGALAGLLLIARRVVTAPAFRITGGAIVGGAVLLATWGDLAVRTAHVDDALAIGGLVGALLLCTAGRPWPAAVILGLAAAAKPWALGFVVIAAAPPGAYRWLRPVAALGVAAACWAPFVLAEPSTLDTSQHGIGVKAESALALVGLGGGTTPGWCRPTQLLVGLILAAWLVARNRWAAAPLAVVAVRLVLDPDVNRYYTVAFVAAALLFEWVLRSPHFPWLTVVGAAVLESTEMVPSPTAAAVLRVVLLGTALVVVCRSGRSPSLQVTGLRSRYATARASRVETPSLV